MDMYKKGCEDSIKSGMKQRLIAGLGFGLSFFVLYSVYAVCFYAGARLAKHGKTTYNGVFQLSSRITEVLRSRFWSYDITLDGVELKKLQLKWLRQQMRLVGQEPVLSNDTIRANIACGKGSEEAINADIVAASKKEPPFSWVETDCSKQQREIKGARGRHIQLCEDLWSSRDTARRAD